VAGNCTAWFIPEGRGKKRGLVQTQTYTLATILEKSLIYYIHPRRRWGSPCWQDILSEKKDPAQGTHMGTKGGIWLMEVILEELNARQRRD
jgi:hypothetical protein